MIPLRTALRVMPAAWFAVPMAILAGWYSTLIATPPGYPLAATAAASGAMPFVGAFVGASAAWEGARLRRSRLWGGAWTRTRLAIAWSVVAVPLAAGILAAGTAVAAAGLGAGALPPDPVILAVLLTDILAYAAIGFAFGLLSPTPLAVPVAALLPILWLAFVPAMDPEWLRHLTGMYRDCCGLEQSLAPQAVIASLAMNAVLVGVAFAACLVGQSRTRRAVAAAATLAAGWALATSFASQLGYAPVVPRDPTLLSCESAGGATVCLWPEHHGSAANIDDVVATVRAGWVSAGIDAPASYTEGAITLAHGQISFHPQYPLTTDSLIVALSEGMLPTSAGCGHATTGGVVVPYLLAWYAASGGMARSSLQDLDAPSDGTNPTVLTVVRDLGRASSATRRAWEARALAASQSCGGEVPDLRVFP